MTTTTTQTRIVAARNVVYLKPYRDFRRGDLEARNASHRKLAGMGTDRAARIGHWLAVASILVLGAVSVWSLMR